MQVALTDENVKLIGRTLREGNVLFLALSGTGIAFSYTGKKLEITVLGGEVLRIKESDGNFARFAVYADGERILDEMVSDAERSYVLYESDTEKTVDIQIIKLSESAMSVMGIRDLKIGEGESVKPLPKKERKIEFIGDSITCGYGVDCEDPLVPFTTATEDVTKSFAFKTAKALAADYSIFSASGYGIISGYTDNPMQKSPLQLIPLYYHSMGFCYDTFANGQNPTDIDWDFTNYRPDVVVINLGTNDDSYCQDDGAKQEEYVEKYVEFLKDVRKKNPGAKIVCALGIMGARLYPKVEETVERYKKETGDLDICSIELPEQDVRLGYACDYHPIERAHDAAAKVLTDAIKKYMDWQ